MAMKLLPVIICLFFNAAYSWDIRTESGLSPDARNKLIEVLNKDRQEIGKKYNIKMEIMKYDIDLEQRIGWLEDSCAKSPSYLDGVTLGGDSHAREIREKHSESIHLFLPYRKTIGCSKDFKCSTTIDNLEGIIVVHRGICIFGEKWTGERLEKIEKAEAELPMPWKYGEIIGVPSGGGSGSGRVLSLIMSLFLVFYI